MVKDGPLHVLLIEDDSLHAKMIQRAIRNARGKCQVSHLPNGKLALDFIYGRGQYANSAQRFRPELILLDIRMPVMDGFEFLRRLKGNKGTQEIPVVVVSTSNRREDIERGHECGASGYVTKSSNLKQFTSDLRAALQVVA